LLILRSFGINTTSFGILYQEKIWQAWSKCGKIDEKLKNFTAEAAAACVDKNDLNSKPKKSVLLLLIVTVCSRCNGLSTLSAKVARFGGKISHKMLPNRYFVKSSAYFFQRKKQLKCNVTYMIFIQSWSK
jgi:hypothetical protein